VLTKNEEFVNFFSKSEIVKKLADMGMKEKKTLLSHRKTRRWREFGPKKGSSRQAIKLNC
jgi:hypothetical protein